MEGEHKLYTQLHKNISEIFLTYCSLNPQRNLPPSRTAPDARHQHMLWKGCGAQQLRRGYPKESLQSSASFRQNLAGALSYARSRRSKQPRAAGSNTSASAADEESPKRVLVPIADGSEEIEAVTVIDVLRRAGAEVIVASVEFTDVTQAESRLECVMSRGVKLVADVGIKEVVGRGKPTFDLIAVPGGMPGAERIRDCIPLDATLRIQADSKRLFAAICAAPAVIFEPKGLLEGYAATAHPAFVDELGGSLEEKSIYAEARVVADGQCITSRGPGTSLEWSLCLVEKLFGPEKAAEVAGPMVVQPANRAALKALEWTLTK
ncbi:hypothetical protein CYMTET_45099 [Cymbomonas tetramitiformis]|uniref:DJ-1/PfpI domain-containing protein n=1 Tax=Cymbomonas tetramitiformis TaxID=36881 RepID=A0AAE0C039_9CHLO|nr:hypothetical protein CYMTET_45099 [Cymbomonas tetramitiformis]